MAVATVRIELGLECKAEVEAELLAELGLTLIINRTVLNDWRKPYYAIRRTTIKELGTVEELQSHMCLFENLSDRPRIGAVTAKLGCKMSQNVAYGIKKGGNNFLPPKIFSGFFRLKISRRF